MVESEIVTEVTTDEEFRPVVGYERAAKVSRSGEIIRLAYQVTRCDGTVMHLPERQLTTRPDGITVCLTRECKTHYLNIAKVVASAWIRAIDDSECVVRLDTNIRNNHVDNLAIVPACQSKVFCFNRSRRRRGKLQRKAELWRRVVDAASLLISNQRRLQSTAMIPPMIRRPFKRKDGVVMITYVNRDGIRVSTTLSQVFRDAFPELAHEIPRRRKAVKTGARSRQKSGQKRGQNRA